MIEVLVIFLFAFVCYGVGFASGQRKGWIEAHVTVADECRKLGKFYVGKTVFTCTHIEEKPSKEVE